MIKKSLKTLKNAPSKNYLCLLDTVLDENEFENNDNEYMCNLTPLIKIRREELNKKPKFPGPNPSNKVYQSDWNGCVSYIPIDDGTLINISMVSHYEDEMFNDALFSAFKLLKNWMIRNNANVSTPKSLFTSLGDEHKKSIKNLLYKVFDNDDSPVLYIVR